MSIGPDALGLRSTLEAAGAAESCSMGDLTVLAVQNDPFRRDTRARQRDGKWLASHLERLGLGDRTIDQRGLHYALVSGEVVKPNDAPCVNDHTDRGWLQADAARAARWLGYVPFEQIADHRNADAGQTSRELGGRTSDPTTPNGSTARTNASVITTGEFTDDAPIVKAAS